MKTILPSTRRHRAGFTLVELLVVIAIIGILAAMLLPAINAVKVRAQKVKAKTEAQAIAMAITAYDSAYGRFPVSSAAQSAAGTGDYTYGGSVLANASPSFSTPNISDNSEVIAILMDITNYPGTSTPTINTNFVKNPRQTIFLNAKMSGDTSSSGVGTDLVYRDPWGNPYIISMDLNYDEVTEDAFYEKPNISAGGLNGLVLQPDGNYAVRDKVMVWSAGPDGKIDNSGSVNAISGANKDNVTSW